MMDSTSVTSQATHGIVKELAAEYEVSLSRMYEILGKDCPYPKTRKLIRRIARHNQEGARLIKADLDALFSEVLQVQEAPSLEDLHKEAFEAVNAMLADKPKAVKEAELRELIAIACSMLAGVENGLKVVGKKEAA
jgi:hypothetical protein